MSELDTPRIPSLFLSARFTEQADELGLADIKVNPADVTEVIRLGRHGAIENLGGLMLHGTGEKTGGRKTNYHVVQPLESPAMPQLGQDTLTRKEVLEAAHEYNVHTLALCGTKPSEPELSLELYRAARRWKEPGSQAGGVPDTWFGVIGGGALGLAFYTIAVGLERAPANLTNYAYAFGIGAAIGGFARPLLQKLGNTTTCLP